MHDYVVESVELITPSTLLLTLQKVDGQGTFLFLPGQYAAISFYHGRRPSPARCFSIASSPTDHEKLQFGMRVKGHYTTKASSLSPGDKVKVRGPFGGFVMDLAGNSDIIFLAGGIGITPFISMSRYANTVKLSNKITLIYSCQKQDDIPFLQELIDLQTQNQNFKVLFVVGEGPVDRLAGQMVYQGRISPEILDAASQSNYQSTTFYMCGPPPFMNAMANTLKAKGVPKQQIITEAFAQGSQRQTGKIKSWPYNIYVLSALGLAVSSFVVMVSDMLKTFPPSSFNGVSSVNAKKTLKNSRQTDLDTLVNQLSAQTSTAPESDAVKAAIAAAEAARVAINANAAQQQAASKSNTSTPTQSRSSTSTSPTASSPTPTPTPPPTKTCTTTQSGVTTCI